METLDEADALRLDNFALKLQLLAAQQLAVQLQQQAFNRELVARYGLDPAADRIELATRSIVRGPAKPPHPHLTAIPPEAPDGNR